MKHYYRNEKNKFNKFFLKLIILLIILNILFILNYLKVLDMNIIKNKLNYNINLFKIVNTIEGNYFNKEIFKDEIEVSSNVKLLSIDNEKRLINTTKEVLAIKQGNIIRIENNNKYYNVYIQTKDDEIYVYKNLSSINVQIYELINVNEAIGNTVLFDQSYYCLLEIKNNNNLYEN